MERGNGSAVKRLSLVLGGVVREREKRLLGLTRTCMGEGFGGIRCELVWWLPLGGCLEAHGGGYLEVIRET